jgi:CBS-domain-containing membrane protein
MTNASKPLLALTAFDLMSPTVVTIPQDMSLQAAAHLLAQADVSGAPVVDVAGRCVGVLSAREFVAWAEHGGKTVRPETEGCDSFCSAWQLTTNDSLPYETVECLMTADPVTVSPLTRIGTLARMMVDARIHRVFVLDRVGRPVGVVSSTDVLAAVARAAQAHGAEAGAGEVGAEDAGAHAGAAEEHEHDTLHSRTP